MINIVNLKEITTKIGSGSTPTGGSEAYKNEGTSLIRSMNIYDFVFQYKGLAFIDDNQAHKLRGVIVEENDILLNITGASVARCCMVPSDILPARVNQHVSIIRIDSSKANPKYILFYINSPSYKNYLLGLAASGATREALTKNVIENLKIPLPSIEVQNKIASILSSYDELIENNKQRIKLLEEMAEEIYKEWFVRLRFPGYENAKIVDGLPEGWENGTIGDFYNVKSGFAFKAEMFGDIGFPIIKIRNIDNWEVDTINCDRYSGEINERIKKFELFNGDLLIAMTGATIGKVALFHSQKESYYLNQRTGKFFCKNNTIQNQSFIYQFTKSKIFQESINNFALGAAQPNISGEQIENLKLLIPSNETLLHFNKLAGNMIEEIFILKEKNQLLQETRDLLLPRLISGKLSVAHLIEKEEALGMVAEPSEAYGK